ncbi:MAG: hypothetical protein V9H26_07370 [Verrucomicrobiota bacterium]
MEAFGDGVEKVAYESRLATTCSAGGREAGAGEALVTVGELTTGAAAAEDGTPVRGEPPESLVTEAGEGVLHTE